jgi:hypothetical protein
MEQRAWSGAQSAWRKAGSAKVIFCSNSSNGSSRFEFKPFELSVAIEQSKAVERVERF